jgi:NADH:ubiquinone oxidoreductase subunit 5 (subunit L)/multisubunit Na+/H+ antiporter MnhA subunit
MGSCRADHGHWLPVLYARYYMAAADPAPRFFSFLLAFMGAMLGIVLSGNLIQGTDQSFLLSIDRLLAPDRVSTRHETGTRDIRRLSGLWRFMPITATLAMVAAAAMAGVPLLNGFLSKEMFFAETIEIHDNSLVDQALPYIVTAASMFTVAYSLRFILRAPAASTAPHPTGAALPYAEVLVLACVVRRVAAPTS